MPLIIQARIDYEPPSAAHDVTLRLLPTEARYLSAFLSGEQPDPKDATPSNFQTLEAIHRLLKRIGQDERRNEEAL